jgi:hypothetical protein
MTNLKEQWRTWEKNDELKWRMTNSMAEWRTWGKSEMGAASQTKGEGRSWNVKADIAKVV